MIKLKLKELKKKVRRCWECSCYVRQVTTTEQAYELDTRRFGDRRCKQTWLKALCYYVVDSSLVYDSPEALLLKLFSDIPYRGNEWMLDHRLDLSWSPQECLSWRSAAKAETTNPARWGRH